MPFRDFFRGLMGLPARSADENNNRDVWSSDPFYDLFRDFSAMVDRTQDFSRPEQPDDDADDAGQYGGSRSGQDDFGFPIFPEPEDMFRHFEEQFRRTFQGFGLMDFPPGFQQPPLEAPRGSSPAQPGGEPGSLRDRMLKPGLDLDEGRADSDLDDRVTDGGSLSALLDRPAPDGHFSSSSSSSVIVRRSVGPDGRVEERRLETGPDGRSRETVTRRLGDRQQTVVTRQQPDGTSEREEQLTNLQPEALPDFDRQWQAPPSAGPEASAATPEQSRLGDAFWRSLFGC
ncbi:uncharacterized protein LOC119101234 [Pollicipes pollicipes]|uniref:uncharacterized protein LOC119101234 n=1 Tax=Pollicipes pollicipes TaxID=41117 RepID=UPI001884E33A|nr:uncharacterized protein LOC119101234 [Pollicipes pollicipes]XP_037080431.1 uncharacterized protein LOC119101234 [Pollicipes pollicipes]